MDVVSALCILFAPLPERLVEICERSIFRHRDKGIAAAVARLIFYVVLFIAGCRIAEISQKAVMQHEAIESIRERTLRSLEPQPGVNTADVLKDSFHSFQQTFLVLGWKYLCVALAVVWKGNGQCVAGALLFIAAVVQHLTEIHLPPALRMSDSLESWGWL